MKKKTEKSENMRALPRYLLLTLLGAVVGGVVGYTSAGFSGGLNETAASLAGAMKQSAPYAMVVSGVVAVGIILALYLRAKKLYAAWDNEDEMVLNHMEQLLNWAMLTSTIEMILGFFFITCHVLYLRDAAAEDIHGIEVALCVGSFLLMAAAITIFQQKTVDLIKKINPEKHGSVYDTSFNKKWIESCDEAERAQIHAASFAAFQFTSKACIILWGVCTVLAMLTSSIGILPSAVVLVIWALLQGSYCISCIRQNRFSTAKDEQAKP